VPGFKGKKKKTTHPALTDMGGVESTTINPRHCSALSAGCASRSVSPPPVAAAMMRPHQRNAVCFQASCLAMTQHQHSNDAYLPSPCSSILQVHRHFPAQLAADYDTAIPIIHSSSPSKPARCSPGGFSLIAV